MTDVGMIPANGEVGPLSDDLLIGAEAIAEFIYGDRRHRRKIYHLVETSRFPHSKLGAQICARKSTLLSWIAEQENGALGR